MDYFSDDYIRFEEEISLHECTSDFLDWYSQTMAIIKRTVTVLNKENAKDPGII